MRKQEAEGASGARTKAAVDCLDTFKQKEEEKAGVAGWGSAERHLWSPVRCEPRERSQSDLIFSASDDTNGKHRGSFLSVWCRSEPPSRRQAVTCGNNESPARRGTLLGLEI